MTIYRYGLLAWVWRVLIFGALAGGGVCAVIAALNTDMMLFVVSASLLLPALFFGTVVATQVDRLDDGYMLVRTLLFTRRVVTRARLGTPKVRRHAQSSGVGTIYAPRAWVPVQGAPPIYLDLLAEIPDRRAFADLWRIPMPEMPRRSA